MAKAAVNRRTVTQMIVGVASAINLVYNAGYKLLDFWGNADFFANKEPWRNLTNPWMAVATLAGLFTWMALDSAWLRLRRAQILNESSTDVVKQAPPPTPNVQEPREQSQRERFKRTLRDYRDQYLRNIETFEEDPILGVGWMSSLSDFISDSLGDWELTRFESDAGLIGRHLQNRFTRLGELIRRGDSASIKPEW